MAPTAEQDMLSRILADPEVQAAAGDTEAQATASDATGQAFVAPTLPPELLGALPGVMSMLGTRSPNGGKKDEKTLLLSALKPYMSKQRCDAIDKLIMISRLGDLLSHLR